MRIAVAGATGLAGRVVVGLAEREGHEVVPIARSKGVDLLDPAAVRAALAGVRAVIDTSQSPSTDAEGARAFFEESAANLGSAAWDAGVARVVVLSIVGAHRSPDYGYYVAKTAQENAVRAHAPGPVILRATQFHEFAGSMYEHGRDGDVARILDIPSQPVDLREVARLLLDLAVGAEEVPADGIVELAGPRPERLVDQVRRLVAHRHDEVTVVPVPAPASLAAGSVLPTGVGEKTYFRGPSYADWLARQAAA